MNMADASHDHEGPSSGTGSRIEGTIGVNFEGVGHRRQDIIRMVFRSNLDAGCFSVDYFEYSNWRDVMRANDETVAKLEYALSVGDMDAAQAAHNSLAENLSSEDMNLVKELVKDLQHGLEIEKVHGRGALLDLAKSPVRYLIDRGSIDQDRAQAAYRYTNRNTIGALAQR